MLLFNPAINSNLVEEMKSKPVISPLSLPPLIRSLAVVGAIMPVSKDRDPENTIPYGAMGHLGALAAARTQCPHFGLLLGRYIGTPSLGLVGELMRNAPTLGDAPQDFAKHQYRNANGGVVYLLKGKKNAFFGYAIYQPDVEGSSVICDAAAMAAHTLVNELMQPNPIAEIETLISRNEPVDLAPYQNLFGGKVHFNANQTAVLFPAAWLERPIAGADAKRRSQLEARLKALSRAGELDIVSRLRRELRVGLLRREISGDQMAEQLGLSRRTLHRRLDEHGVTFQQIQDEVRCEFARQLLLNTRLSIAKIGMIVCYTEAGVFTRAFTRWTGMSPSGWREARGLPRTLSKKILRFAGTTDLSKESSHEETTTRRHSVQHKTTV